MSVVDFRGQTTIVTGASSGLGAEFARQLAGRGSDLVLVARRADRLEALGRQFSEQHKIRVTAVERDLAEPDAGRALRAELEGQGIHATSLVNNAGFGPHGPFAAEDPGTLQKEITLNVSALVDLSRAYIDPLAQAGTGVLINVASLLGFQPMPYMAVYGATKSFVLDFTEALWEETRGTGLRVLALCPGAIETEFFEVAGSQKADLGSTRATPAHVVATALATLDRRTPPPSVITNGRILALLGRVMPRRQMVRTIGRMQRKAMH